MVNHSKLPVTMTLALDIWADFSKKMTPGGGPWLWGMLLLLMGALYVKRWEIAVVLAPSLATWVTLLLGPPVASPFRYIAFASLITLFAFAMIFQILKNGAEILWKIHECSACHYTMRS